MRERTSIFAEFLDYSSQSRIPCRSGRISAGKICLVAGALSLGSGFRVREKPSLFRINTQNKRRKEMSARIQGMMVAVALALVPTMAQAQSFEGSSGNSLIGLAAGLVLGIAAFGGTTAQGKAVSSSVEAIGRNPSAAKGLFVPMILGLVFIETLVIFSFVVALQLIGKL